MNKKLTISITTAVVASACAAVLFVPHTVTVKERIGEPVEDAKMETSSVKTSLFESLTNPKKVTPSKKDNATYTAILDEDGNYIKDGLLKNVVSAKTVYVDYKPTAYSATYTVDGTEYFTTTYKAGEEPAAPSTDELASTHPYEDFKEWVPKNDEKLADTAAANHSVTYEATFTGKTYKITYDLDGGNAENPDSYQYGVGVDSLNNASKNGYTFDGWYSDADKTQKVESISKDDHDNKTLYAKFHENPKPVVKPQPAQKATGSANVNAGRTYSNSGNNNGGGSTTSAGVSFPYIGNAGALTLSSGYSVALGYGYTQANVDAPYTAAYYDCEGNEMEENPDGSLTGKVLNTFTIVADHNYGVPAALPATLNSNTMWLRHADGSVEILHKAATIRTDSNLRDSAGNYYLNGANVNKYGRLMFQTCDETGAGRVLTFWN